jgi:ATP-dependent helicase Lhr and Lhr-like helicase
MVAEGFSTRRGRRAALVHRDEVHRMLRGRRGSRLLALTAGGAIPEVADYRVILEPDETFIGTLNEDFAIESMPGDVFQLGNASWRVVRISTGTVRVADAQGAPPSIPFWFGEAPARSDELSREVSNLRADVESLLTNAASGHSNVGASSHSDAGAAFAPSHEATAHPPKPLAQADTRPLTEWLQNETGICEGAAEQIAAYFEDGHRVLGVIPTQETLVLERFFDESGGMQLVLHAPLGSRINRAWALALRKRFCRQFNFELQAAATEDAILLSLGEQHSFPLADVFRYLHPATVRDILVQAFLDAPVFQTRWRWNATISLAVPRNRNGSKVPPQLQRMQAEDLMAAVFPDAAACLENIPGDRQIPDHPLVTQTVRDCLEEAMDLDGLVSVLEQVRSGALRCVSRDTPEPSVFAHEILNARPYAFLDDAPLEERRAHAVQTRRTGEQGHEDAILDANAIARVRDEARPDPRDPEELHDALLTSGFLRDDELDVAYATALQTASRATRAPALGAWFAAERLPELLAAHPEVALSPAIAAPPSRTSRAWTRHDAIVELLRNRLAIVGPVSAADLGASLGIAVEDADSALVALEGDGVALRGSFTPGARTLEWCDRRLLARIHRYTLDRLRAEIAPVSAADFMRFLLTWQHVAPSSALSGIDGLRAIVAQLEGVELPARAWERYVLPARLDRYDPASLDLLCLTGQVGWARLSAGPTQVVGATPVSLFLREHADVWLSLRDDATPGTDTHVSSLGQKILEHLRGRGASFGTELIAACHLSDEDFRVGITELVGVGLITSDGFAGLRGIIRSSSANSRHNRAESAGRWCELRRAAMPVERDAAVEALAWTLLRRYGVLFRRLLTREAFDVPWRELSRVCRRLEARGEIRGGRFVSGMSGEQFALPDAVERLREVRRSAHEDRLIVISAADPLNLTGIITSGDRIRTAAANRIVYRNGVPLAAMEGDMLRMLTTVDPAIAADVAAAAAGRRVPVLSGYVGRIQ